MTPSERERRIERCAEAFSGVISNIPGPDRWAAERAAEAFGLDELLGRAERAEAAVRDLRRAIAEHRTIIHNAGTVRIDSRDQPQAEAKYRADKRLWAILDHPSFSGEEGTGG